MSRWEGTRILALVFMAGVAGGFVGIDVTSWLADGPEVLGAPWWEAMTAFGTVGAVIGTVLVAWVGHFFRKRENHSESLQYASSIRILVGRTLMRLGQLRAPFGVPLTEKSHLTETMARELKDILMIVSVLDSVKLSVAFSDGAGALGRAQLFLHDAVFIHESIADRNINLTVDSMLESASIELQKLLGFLNAHHSASAFARR